ncbi:MAG: prephenate dehydrogenase dimerization domain-containing protein, partial [Candidatus Auribacterota bacterium]|nr:prephenate dehydrogenase dimerization domain-containing protein [Candidatus Auribacterota bacterium]
AGSSASMWTEIITVNKKAVLSQIDGMLETLMLVKQHVKSGDPNRIKAWLQKARRRQRGM